MILQPSIMEQLKRGWGSELYKELQKDYIVQINSFIHAERKVKTIYPHDDEVFKALLLTPRDYVKVCILSQDPSYTKGYAHGLAFSTTNTTAPASLKNIFDEIRLYDKLVTHSTNDLTSWTQQGVLLLNTCLTVEEGKPNSHQHIGWYDFTRKVIELLNANKTPVVFLLMGSNALAYEKYIDNGKIVRTTHPSPLSYSKPSSTARAFLGSNAFGQINNLLEQLNQSPIRWDT